MCLLKGKRHTVLEPVRVVDGAQMIHLVPVLSERTPNEFQQRFPRHNTKGIGRRRQGGFRAQGLLGTGYFHPGFSQQLQPRGFSSACFPDGFVKTRATSFRNRQNGRLRLLLIRTMWHSNCSSEIPNSSMICAGGRIKRRLSILIFVSLSSMKRNTRSALALARISHQAACCSRIFVLLSMNSYALFTMMLLHTALDAPSLVFFAPAGTCSLRPSLGATLRAAVAVQIGYLTDLSLNQTNLPGADLDVRRTPAGSAPGMGRINYGYAFGRRHPLAQKIRRDHHITW